MNWWNPFRGLMQGISRIESSINVLTQLQGVTMHSLAQVLEQVQKNTTKVASLVALIDGLRVEVKTVLANSAISAEDQGRVEAIFDAVAREGETVQAALDANTPAAPVPVVGTANSGPGDAAASGELPPA